uniref:Uncharacterized protein n=1 Tax=Ditylenchus dipsaci TaxID=166011 RepID=A0A915DML4_9BILA
MLSRKNVGYASTCNVVGQTVGFSWQCGLFDPAIQGVCQQMVPFSACRQGLRRIRWIRLLLGWVFLVTTTIVLIFKREVDHSVVGQDKAEDEPEEEEELTLGVVDTYAILARFYA